ncbi:MAG TPA: potassium channel protein [Gallionellaceae bacterium]|nr:potassium channel protein [Gallionellaceae bacterium]
MKLAEFTSSRVYRSLAWSSIAMVLILMTGTVGYRIIGGEQYSWIDCFYMTFITVATIGYGEIVDLSESPGGRLFTVLIATLGIGTMTYMLSTVTAFILESDINQVWRRKKMTQTISKISGHYIVCGVGRVGSNVAHELVTTGRECVVMDSDLQHLETFLEKYPAQPYMHSDATDNDALLAAGVMRARGLFAVATDDSQNLVISLSAKQLNPNLRVVARCHDLKNVEKTRKAGADEIVSPDFTGGLRIVSAMVRPHVVSFMDEMLKTENNLRMEEFPIPAEFAGKSLGVLNLGSRHYVLLAIRQNQQWTFNPDTNHTIKEGDVLMVMTTPQGRNRLERLMQGVA